MDKLRCSMTNIKYSNEPGKMIIEGNITKIDTPSDGSPHGAKGKKLVFTNDAVLRCAKTWVDTPLNCIASKEYMPMNDHGETNIGTIRDIAVADGNVAATIVLWKEKFPEIAAAVCANMDDLGFSVEAQPKAFHEDDANVYVDDFFGLGCALLWKDRAAWHGTGISEVAASERKDDENMTKEEILKKATAIVLEGVGEICRIIWKTAKKLATVNRPTISFCSIDTTPKHLRKDPAAREMERIRKNIGLPPENEMW